MRQDEEFRLEVQGLANEMEEYLNFLNFTPSEIFMNMEAMDEKTRFQFPNFQDLQRRYKLFISKFLGPDYACYYSVHFYKYSYLVNLMKSIVIARSHANRRADATKAVMDLIGELYRLNEEIRDIELGISSNIQASDRQLLIQCEQLGQAVDRLNDRFKDRKNLASPKSQNQFHTQLKQVNDQITILLIEARSPSDENRQPIESEFAKIAIAFSQIFARFKACSKQKESITETDLYDITRFALLLSQFPGVVSVARHLEFLQKLMSHYTSELTQSEPLSEQKNTDTLYSISFQMKFLQKLMSNYISELSQSEPLSEQKNIGTQYGIFSQSMSLITLSPHLCEFQTRPSL